MVFYNLKVFFSFIILLYVINCLLLNSRFGPIIVKLSHDWNLLDRCLSYFSMYSLPENYWPES